MKIIIKQNAQVNLSHLLKFGVALFILLIFTSVCQSEYPWPVAPLNESHVITGTFCEYRDTGSSDHFHNGIDIQKPDGSPVYPVQNGTVSFIERSGSNAYVRVDRFCYIHINPNPALTVGSSVIKGQTVLGTILPGAGHVHLTDGYYDSELNPLRIGGIDPYDDPWEPQIRALHFYKDGTNQRFTGNRVSGAVDIMVHVEEQNGPGSSSSSVLNNGTYLLGYQILSANRDSIIYSPSETGIVFQFDNKPNDIYVHNVFCDWEATLSKPVYIVTNQIKRNGYWDTRFLESGDYTVKIFTEDTRHNKATDFVTVTVTDSDIDAPATPELKYVRETDNGFEIAWYPNFEPDLERYILYYSYDAISWTKRMDIPADCTSYSFKANLLKDIYFKLSACDNAAMVNESEYSDIYGFRKLLGGESKLLIVDGYDRGTPAFTGGNPSHAVCFHYGKALAASESAFDACANNAIADGSIDIAHYDGVIWFVCDESEKEEILTADEQRVIGDYLKNGGRLFIDGLNIAKALDPDADSSNATEDDERFLHNFLKVDYAGSPEDVNRVTGIDGTIFEDFTADFGSTAYSIVQPDGYFPIHGSRACLLDSASQSILGIQYSGTFDNGVSEGKLVLASVPIEMIADSELQNGVISRILTFFSMIPSPVNDSGKRNLRMLDFRLFANYPNPFNSSTVISYSLAQSADVNLKIYNLCGQIVRTLISKNQSAGNYNLFWHGDSDDGQQLPNGIYYYRLTAGSFRKTMKAVLLK
ncbi:T9SS type A sorting domain-containing protein [candidate division KSB1 bacterium]|nr:T9SS type A sorting domain-containing protein [candidate division KSB1 bacterium]